MAMRANYMKTVKMSRDFSFRAGPRVFIQFKDATIYERVTEAQAKAIVDAGAGEVVIAVRSPAHQAAQSE